MNEDTTYEVIPQQIGVNPVCQLFKREQERSKKGEEEKRTKGERNGKKEKKGE